MLLWLDGLGWLRCVLHVLPRLYGLLRVLV
jgi:hypothetical protein